MTIDPDAAPIEVDLRDNTDCLPCGLNLSEACARTAAMVGIFNSIDHTVPRNAGSFRRIDVSCARTAWWASRCIPPRCSVATTNFRRPRANAVQAAIAEIADQAGHGRRRIGDPAGR